MADASTSGASERHSALPKTGCTGRPNDRVARTARRVTVALAVVYPIALLLFAAGLRFGGERWWLTTVVLYLPRIGFALPLPLLTVALVVIRAYSLLATQATALAILLFPLMGLELGGSSSRNDSGVRLRIMTMNIALGMDGIERVVELVRGAEADIVVLEEVGSENVEPLKAGLSDYTVRSVDQFIVASRLPIGQLSGPPRCSTKVLLIRRTTPAAS